MMIGSEVDCQEETGTTGVLDVAVPNSYVGYLESQEWPMARSP